MVPLTSQPSPIGSGSATAARTGPVSIMTSTGLTAAAATWTRTSLGPSSGAETFSRTGEAPLA
jgi:hypothetical protein